VHNLVDAREGFVKLNTASATIQSFIITPAFEPGKSILYRFVGNRRQAQKVSHVETLFFYIFMKLYQHYPCINIDKQKHKNFKMKKITVFIFAAIPLFLTSFLGAGSGQNFLVLRAGAASAPNSSLSSNTSLNWAGYVAPSGSFNAVGASWAIPAATSTNNNIAADATWVGIGGVSSNDLIQAGTQAIIQNDAVSYEAWYEILPAASQEVPLTVHPGDSMTVSITEPSTNQWQISFSDATTGQNYQASVSYDSSLSSAEWIEEMPSDQGGFVPLDSFGTVSFTNAFAVNNGSRMTIAGLSAQPMTMITGAGQVLASVSSLGSDGASFSVMRSAATASTSTITRRGRWSRTGVGVQGYTAPQPRRPQGNGSSSFRGFSSFFRSFGGNMKIRILF
jgi:hypothetical protein